jgi:hypothetical protein
VFACVDGLAQAHKLALDSMPLPVTTSLLREDSTGLAAVLASLRADPVSAGTPASAPVLQPGAPMLSRATPTISDTLRLSPWGLTSPRGLRERAGAREEPFQSDSQDSSLSFLGCAALEEPFGIDSQESTLSFAGLHGAA